MRRTLPIVVGTLLVMQAAVWTAPAPKDQIGDIMKRVQQVKELRMSEEEEVELGAAVSQKIRVRYGVVQDAAVHRYVTLVGASLVQTTKRPNLPWTFIVLDTDGVNAFAAPGGYIHITRGALGLIASEAELAGVLAHELTHVTEKHAVKAIQNSKRIQFGADVTLKDKQVFQQVVEASTEVVMAGFGRKEELEADREGARLADTVGYAPIALSAFLTRLTDRNKSASEKQGLFASHPEMRERIDRLSKQVASDKLTGAATLEDRYQRNISYTAKPQTQIAAVEAGAVGLAGGGSGKTEEPPKKRGLGLGALLKPTGSEKKSAEVTGSGASRGVDTERNAKGGPVSTLVAVAVKLADILAFKKEGKLR